MSGCTNHEWFDENCQACGLSVSRPTTKNDLPSPFGMPVDMINGIPVNMTIDPSLVDAASNAGKRRMAAEAKHTSSIAQARKELCGIVKRVQKASGELHVPKEQLTLGNVTITAHNATISGADDIQGLLHLWELIPNVLRTHIETCEKLTQYSEEQAAQAATIFQGARAVRALVGTNAPALDKNSFVRRVMTDPDLVDALDAADDSGLPRAAIEVIRQQVGVPPEDTLTDLFMSHLAQAYTDWAKSEALSDGFALLFSIQDVGEWAFIPPSLTGSGEPEVERNNAHWKLNADLVLEIHKTPFEHLLMHIPSAEVSAALMNQYFNGQLTINGGSASEPEGIETHFVQHVGQMFAIAHNGFSVELDNRNADAEDHSLANEDDIPF